MLIPKKPPKVFVRRFSKAIESNGFRAPIFRCIHFERLIEMIMYKKMIIGKTTKWEDT